ncbi:patatin-like phospholipase family protein [Desulforamulus ruminis]|uniref:Patatin n=1 Tax=Desulforamulus ruminis (strain ATCC 23193 / DSM 2154 / NCIMB 8452 / DL) TaxID=696281 RepID=F6DKE6_DESRL|nr:patatin-like phospholipase family protein [Desulforamulus ruminis]AEG61563.1 Patatin [Desulforamulus ruminis DSM 2154]
MVKKIGLALGGGFVRGAAHVGVLKVLEENGIRPRLMAGTSAGSFIASLYASGWSIPELERMARKLKPGFFIDEFAAVENFFVMTAQIFFEAFRFSYPFRPALGLMRGCKLEHFIRALLGKKKFEGLRMDLAIAAVDICTAAKVIFVSQSNELHMRAKENQVFITGVPIWEAVRASTSVPGLYEPKKIGDYLLVDGGLRENVPAQILKAMGAEVVIAVDLGNDGQDYKEPHNIVDVLTQTVDIIGSDTLEQILDEYADIRIRPLLKGVGPWDFGKVPYMIRQGELATRQLMPEILKAIY